MSSKARGCSGGECWEIFEAEILVTRKSGGPPEGGLEPSIRWGQVRAGPGWGPQPTLSAVSPGCPKDLALVWSCGVLGSCSRAPPSPVRPTDCSLSSPPWLLPQGAFPSGAGHCPCSPVTPPTLSVVPPLYTAKGFSRNTNLPSLLDMVPKPLPSDPAGLSASWPPVGHRNCWAGLP